MEQSLADRGDGQELIDTKIEGVDSTDKVSWPSQTIRLVCNMGLPQLIMHE